MHTDEILQDLANELFKMTPVPPVLYEMIIQKGEKTDNYFCAICLKEYLHIFGTPIGPKQEGLCESCQKFWSNSLK